MEARYPDLLVDWLSAARRTLTVTLTLYRLSYSGSYFKCVWMQKVTKWTTRSFSYNTSNLILCRNICIIMLPTNKNTDTKSWTGHHQQSISISLKQKGGKFQAYKQTAMRNVSRAFMPSRDILLSYQATYSFQICNSIPPQCYHIYWKCRISKHLPDATHVIWMLTHESIPIFHGRIYDTCHTGLRACQRVRNELEMNKGHRHTDAADTFMICTGGEPLDAMTAQSNIEKHKHRFQQSLINKTFYTKKTLCDDTETIAGRTVYRKN
jgi:hypothetical protein